MAAGPDDPSGRSGIGVELLILAASVYWVLAANTPFFTGALGAAGHEGGSRLLLLAGLGLALVALHALLLSLVCTRWSVKPVLAVLTLAAALASHFSSAYGTVLDPPMLRNLMRTHPAEAFELLTPSFALHLALYAALPIALLWRLPVRRRPWKRAVVMRLGLMAGCSMLLLAVLALMFQPLSSLMRNHRELRYLAAPVNTVWSAGAAFAREASASTQVREPIGLDAGPGSSWAGRTRPLVVVLVVGETARAANWGLNASAGMPARATTPALARLEQRKALVNFSDVRSCGTDTETSLPCMFAPMGRRQYDERRIRRQQSLLHVVQRAGVGVLWRDNQSGCKGVCDGLPLERPARDEAGCGPEGCLDEALIAPLERQLGQARGTQLWVLHMIGSHGPAYFRRYPPAFARFQPACNSEDFSRCSVEEIRNAYDNTLLYTDHLLASAIAQLERVEDRVDSVLVYVSDHGESLGERGLFLHGMPWAIAPEVQTRVPMVVWTSRHADAAAGVPAGCLREQLARQSRNPVSHDHLFHTLLGLLDVRTGLYDGGLDLTSGCRRAAANAS